jgi:dTDP-4-amino-4,6-dideoxygalactose transaminase
MEIPFVDLNVQNTNLQTEIETAIRSVIDDSGYIAGPAVAIFEKAFAQWHGSGQVLGVGSGSEALNLALKSLDLKPGDEVITVPNTWISTAFAISHAGATPVFADIDPDTHQMDMAQLSRQITSRTRAVVAVHMFGHPAPVDQIVALCQPKGIQVIEDVAQAVGAEIGGKTVGTFGDIACFSFYPSKNLGCLGDGGAVLTSDDDLAEKLRVLACYGQSKKFHHTDIGWNSRLDGIQAAVLSVKLPYLNDWTEARRQHAKRYDERLRRLNLTLPKEAEGVRHVFNLYVIELAERDTILEALRARGVLAQVHHPTVIHLQECYKTLEYRKGDFPVAEQSADRILSLPIYPELTETQLDYVTQVLEDIMEEKT